MKKLIAFVTMLSITVSSSIVPCFANEQVVVSEETRDFWEEIIDTLDENEYGGAYIKDGVLHIKPQDEVEMQSILSETAPNSRAASSVILDDEAEYTLNELNEASDKSEKIWKELKLDYVAISERDNGLIVGAYEWTEEKKERFKEVVGINNVFFELVEDGIEVINNDEDFFEEIPTEEPAPKSSGEKIILGQQMSDFDALSPEGYPWLYTIGACILGENVTGYITAGHGEIQEGHTIGDRELKLGKVYEKIVSPSKGLDIALIEKQPNAPLTSRLPNNGIIVSSGRPIEGDQVTIAGGAQGFKYAEIRAASCKKYWNTDGDSGSDDEIGDDYDNLYFNIMMMKFIGRNRTVAGDSGAPILVSTGSGNRYKLVGIYKGVSETGPTIISDDLTDEEIARYYYKYAYGTRWDLVAKYFWGDIYTE